jgi:hypothetical protein
MSRVGRGTGAFQTLRRSAPFSKNGRDVVIEPDGKAGVPGRSAATHLETGDGLFDHLRNPRDFLEDQGVPRPRPLSSGGSWR